VSPRRANLGRRVGAVGGRGRFRTVAPLFERGAEVPIGRGSAKASSEEIVLADFGAQGARILRSLGRADRAADVVAALIDDAGLRRGFGTAVENEARDAAPRAAEAVAQRVDLTALPTFTVDPATARDFDDAVSAEREGDGVVLRIHIADVAAHVRPEGRLDSVAAQRATSVYVPGTVEPMLPPLLSDEACSLAPGVERLAVSTEIHLDARARVQSVSFARSRIRSDARLDYDQLDRVFAGREEPPADVAAPLEIAREVAAALAGRRGGAALEIDSAEPEFEFDSEGNVARAHSVPQTEAHRLIEQLMILTNELVAAHCEQRKVKTLYRVHEQPDPARVERLIEQLASLDVPTPPLPTNLSRTDAGQLVAEASRLVAREAERRGHGRNAWTSLVLRSLKQAFYTPRNLGHAGLGSPAYCHFTSPIRRYPDLIAHRALLSTLGLGEEAPDGGEVSEAGWHCSEREREAMKIERSADRACATFLLNRELFEAGWAAKFEGEVSGVIGAGAFVRFAGELADVYEGFLPVRRLRGDRFNLNEQETALVGDRTGETLRLGDPVTVVVDSVEAPRGRVDLSPAASESPS
jgi:ribonuclease R